MTPSELISAAWTELSLYTVGLWEIALIEDSRSVSHVHVSDSLGGL